MTELNRGPPCVKGQASSVKTTEGEGGMTSNEVSGAGERVGVTAQEARSPVGPEVVPRPAKARN